jgi:L-arabinonolactonase
MDEAEPCEPIAGLYRLDRDLSVTHLIDGVRCSNSLCFSPDGRTMYFACSLEREIRAYDYEPETGALSNRRVFCRLDDQPGLPDGSTVDAEGCLWNAQWGAKRVVRYRPNGRIDGIIEIPALNPTCVAFGGRDLDTLFVTTARKDMTPEQIARYPASGGLFAMRPGCRGLPEPTFAG